VDLLRPNVPQALHLLQQVLLEPQFLEEELEEAKMALMFQRDQIHFAGGDGPNPRKPDAATELVDSVIPPDMLLSEALQTAAYGADQPLGQPHVCPPQAMVGMTRTGVMDFWQQHVVGNPGGLVVGGAGVCHDELVDLAARSFGHLQQQEQTADKVTEYRGGEARWQLPGTPQSPIDEYGWIRVCVAFPVEGGWHSPDLVPACVLQTLLGGGSSFSAGGPGKGMYSRLYRQVLNRYGWAESAEAFSAFYQETGLWGISGSVKDARKAGDMVRVLAEHLARLAVDPVSDEELNRARNMLRCNVLTQLESRLVLFEDMARQVLTYGQREDMLTTCAKIDAVTAADVQHMAQKALQHAPTLASTGVDLQHVPRYDEVSRWFR
jgi:processing peptidase subunit alpha